MAHLDRNSADGSAIRQSSGPQSEQWVVHRGLITKLYMEDNLPLKSVIEYMNDHLGFKAR